jgi:hypothetical protein
LKEEEMKGVVKDYFANLGFVGFEEVPIRQKRIDLYFIHRNYPKTIAVELKKMETSFETSIPELVLCPKILRRLMARILD